MPEDPKQWQPVLTDAFHPMRYPTQVVRKVLGDDVYAQRNFSKVIPMWRWPLWGVAFEDMTTQKGGYWERERVFGDDWHREGAPGYMMVPVAVDKERAILSDGGAVLKYGAPGKEKTRQFVVNFSRIGRAVLVDVIAKGDAGEYVEKFFSDINDWISKNNFYKGKKIDANGVFLNLSDVEEGDLVLAADIKRELFRNVKTMVQKWGDYAKFGIPGKRGVILAGPPGNGKSLSMKVLAKSLDCTFLWCTPRHVMEADGFAQIYEFARELAPSVVLIEDADVFGLDRRLGGFSPLLGELLNVLDGFVENKGVITILSSNYVEVMDTALTRRPGRFDTKILIGPPAAPEAQELLRRTLERRKVTFNGDPTTLKVIGSVLADMKASGAFIVEVVNYAMMLAVERGQGQGARLVLSKKDLEDSVDRVRGMLEFDEVTQKAIVETGIFKWGGWSQGEVFDVRKQTQ